jgi:hypothetical protein
MVKDQRDNALVPGVDVDIDGQPWTEEGAEKQRAQDIERELRHGNPMNVEQFHAHLDLCVRCRTQPFNLCPQGAALLVDAIVRG